MLEAPAFFPPLFFDMAVVCGVVSERDELVVLVLPLHLGWVRCRGSLRGVCVCGRCVCVCGRWCSVALGCHRLCLQPHHPFLRCVQCRGCSTPVIDLPDTRFVPTHAEKDCRKRSSALLLLCLNSEGGTLCVGNASLLLRSFATCRRRQRWGKDLRSFARGEHAHRTALLAK